MRRAVHHDVALPALPLTDIVEDGNSAGGLHDAAEAAAISGAEFRQTGGETAVRECCVLGPVMAIHAPGVVSGGNFAAAG